MKIKLVLFFALYSIIGFGQGIKMELPILSPQSPTTSDLGKYGEIQVNESTGKIAPSIPLFEYYTGNINLPITLGYSGNGVRVNQDPTWTGINWNLNPGGVITRAVRDKVDELTSYANTKRFSKAGLDNLPGLHQRRPNSLDLDPNTVWYQTIENFFHEEVDTEADIFNYNFLGYSGSFYLEKKESGLHEVHLIKYDKELAITFNFITGNKSQIVIKTPEGDTYSFGLEASESSKTWLNVGAGSQVNIPYAQNAFYLYQVAFLKGGAINFTYESFDTSCDYTKIGIQESISKSTMSMCTKTERTLNSNIERLVKLKKITSTLNLSQYVEFDISSYGECGRMFKLNNVFLKTDTQVLKKVKLNYLTINNEPNPLENKFFLSKVEFFNKDNQFEYDYELTYESPNSLPSKASFSQDDLGFYNGKPNSTLLPKTTKSLLNDNCYNLANREADLFYSKKGSLSEIKYPTGGSSQFEYELPYKGKEIVNVDHFITAYYRDPYRANSSLLESIYYPDAGDGPLVVTTPSSINMSMSITAMGAFSHQNNVTISIINNNNGQVVWTNDPFGNNGPIGRKLTTTDNVIKNYSNTYTCTLNPGSYIFKLKLNLYAIDPASNYVIANVQFALPNGFRDVYFPGLRVKRIKSMDNNSTVKTTRYYYNRLPVRNEETYNFYPNYISITRGLDVGDNADGALTDFYNLSANSVKNSFNMDEPVYPYVTVSYGGDNFEKGAKQMSFTNQSDYPAEYYETNPALGWDTNEWNFSSYVDVGTNDSYQNSVLGEEIYFNAALNPIKKIQYNYSGTEDAAINNIKLYKFVPSSNYGLSHTICLLYKTKSHKYRLISTETKEYFGSTFLDEIASTTTQTYSPDKVSLPSSIEITNILNSSLSETKRTNIYYPSDILTIGNLSADDNASIPVLTQKHNVSEIIKTENLLNGSVLDTKQVSFKNWGGLVLPSIIKSSKGANPLEDRIVFESYDFYGKPTLVSLKNGLKTEYLYNTKQQVILKVENFDPSFTIDDGLNTSTPCYYQTLYPTCMVTKYNYDATTNNLISIIDSKCDKITYNYDAFGRLKNVTDKDGNILSENEYHYKN